MGGLNNPVTDCTAAANLSRTWPDFRKNGQITDLTLRGPKSGTFLISMYTLNGGKCYHFEVF